MFAFLVVLFFLITIYGFTSASYEGFESKSLMHKVVIPTSKFNIPSPDKNPSRDVDISKVNPSTIPGTIPIAPYEQIAAMSPLPYQDTTLIKANRQQLLSLLENLKGFLAFEAQQISEQSDPSIQLPLQSAKSDFHILQNEVAVLNRNPGIQPTITLTTMNEISANLAYLQQHVRLSGNAGTLQGPVYEYTEEGFQVSPTGTVGTGTAGTGSRVTQVAQVVGVPATVNELKGFIGNIQGEILRLSASGTTDPIIRKRVTILTELKSFIQSIVDKVAANALRESEIPIMKSDIDKALPLLGNPSEPLPNLIKSLNLPAGLANMLPSYMKNDPDAMREISKLVDKYADTIVNGVSASFSIKYTSPNEVSLGHSHNKYGENQERISKLSTVNKTGFPSIADLHNVSNVKFTPYDSGNPITDHLASKPSEYGRGPSHFDWKQRAKEIESQVKKRGLKQSDFGIMSNGTNVSNEFSWKGYARMICTRLNATMDTGLPELCGCPPMDWRGWRGA